MTFDARLGLELFVSLFFELTAAFRPGESDFPDTLLAQFLLVQ